MLPLGLIYNTVDRALNMSAERYLDASCSSVLCLKGIAHLSHCGQLHPAGLQIARAAHSMALALRLGMSFQYLYQNVVHAE